MTKIVKIIAKTGAEARKIAENKYPNYKALTDFPEIDYWVALVPKTAIEKARRKK